MPVVRRAVAEASGLYRDAGVVSDVPALAWFLLSSLAPLALGLTALASVLLGDYAEAQSRIQKVDGVLPNDAHDQLVALILRTPQDSPWVILIAIVGMVWTTSGAVGVLERRFARLLDREPRGMVVRKLTTLGIAAALALLIVVLVLVATAGTSVVHRIGIDATLTRLLVPLVTLGVIAATCGAVFRALTGSGVSWRAALAGGAVSAVVLEVTPTVAGYYLRFVAGDTPVDLFLMLAGILFTCYLVAVGMLVGAGVTVRLHREAPAPAP